MASPLVFVTGGTGFVGSAIVRALLGKHPTWKLSVLDMSIDKGMCQERGIAHPNVEFVAINILDIPSLNEAFQHRRPEAVIHVAGFVPPLEDRYRRRLWKQAYRINVDGTRNVLDAAKKVGVKAFVYTSTCCVVIDDYTQSYANIDERWPVVEQGTASIYATTFGEGDHQLLPSIVSCIIDKNESVFQVGDGLNLWDTVYVGNSADAHVLALENLLSDDPSAAGEAFFIQNNEPTSFREFCLAVWKQYNGHVPSFTVPVPAGLAWVLGAVMEALTWFTHTPATLSRGSVNDATAIRYASGEKSRRILGYEPRFSTEEGLKRTCTEYRQRREKSGSHPKSNTEMLIQQLKASLN
ncbi:erg26, C-3 sterol dehydrogenase [Lithohypha guttulata]|nr:erg26, C-3 sterol dehydrogenase [Lithohypha guttulata]